MKTMHVLLATTLVGLAGAATAAPNCTIALKANDQMQFDQKAATVSAACPTITITLKHTGTLPITSMGHDVVITKTADMPAVAAAGMAAGAAAHYLPKGDARIIAATPMVGGGASTKTTFPGKKLTAGGAYSFFCSFPGHSAIMKGTLTVTK
ncbi:azurin [Lysobacter sp. TY2-98]|uniref:azurin n=1 Tax=Lysobacter sp. TY2-98 TaxID=2290922 RepID=UPI000E1FF889|nr:azurin [Lysobacter sp. TY2-98]AXK71065.1 azurin [Lysobacter sp. TY2-98]